jgi:beta-glucosidase
MLHMTRARFVSWLLLIFTFSPLLPAQTTDAQVRRRADDLLRQMTVEEKIGQLNQVPGVAVPALHLAPPDDAIRSGHVGSVLWQVDRKELNRLQHIAVEQSRLHIPLLVGFDVIHGYRTIFPVPLAMASSWDPSVEEQAQRVAAEDARAAGINWTFAPMVDIARDARWGRIVEGAGEDPFLGAAMARAQVRGFQGENLGNPGSVLACAKHFAGYGAADGGRDYDSSYLPDVLLRNVYFPPFQAAVDAGVGSFMSAYMDLNDIPASGNRFLLHDVLRGEWGFKGFVVSDAFAVGSLVTHGFARDPADAAHRALAAGVNMDMASGTFENNLATVLKQETISIEQLDNAVRPVLEAKLRLGLFENPYADESRAESVLNRPESRQLERKLAARSMVLLSNRNGTLPLSKSLRRVAVVGTLADSATAIEGSWTVEDSFGAAKQSNPVTILKGLQAKAGPGVRIEYAEGPEIQRDIPTPLDQFLNKPQPPAQTPEQGQQAIRAAVAVAQASDVTIAVLGEHATMSGEASSRATLQLPGRQEELLEALVATGKPVVVVLVNGRPLDISWASQHAAAILEAWYPGTEGGNAVADVLFGEVNPGGKLPVSWPRSVGQEPLYYSHNLTHQPDNAPGFISRYWDSPSSPLYPFGYGLSYSSFRFSTLQVRDKDLKPGETADISVTVTNTSNVAGDVVAQLYIHQQAGSASRPMRQLKGFQRVPLAAGASRTLHFQLESSELSFWSPETKSTVLEPGLFDVWVGEDSTAALHTEINVVSR